jgi:predicted phage baseplate assembly protein
MGHPRLRHILTSRGEEAGVPVNLSERISDGWDQQSESDWFGRDKEIFELQPNNEHHPYGGNSLYLVLKPDEALQANVLAINFKGPAATPTGIDPLHPPRYWEAWNGQEWKSVLLKETDDRTRGFSFQGRNPEQGADVILHLPHHWPEHQIYGYHGYWLRCRVTEPENRRQSSYSSSPRIAGIAVRSIGGTVAASQCVAIDGEQLGTSDGNPGQRFQLQRTPVLDRDSDKEYVLVTPPNGLPQRWQEVSDFATSTPMDLHYTLDSATGTIQFGPLIREPGAIQQSTQERARTQRLGVLAQNHITPINESHRTGERQYGAVPPPNAVISMVRYRTGGGGNLVMWKFIRSNPYGLQFPMWTR